MTKTKLQLTWIGKDKRPRLEPRILLEDPTKSYRATNKVSENDIFDNKLIKGDNLLALKALEREYAGKVKCIFIDPPYNTGSAFNHYDDGLEHSIWLGLMRDRLEVLKSLLAEDGSIWISLDNNEVHYLKVLCDEIFGRANYLGDLIWKKRKGGGNDSQFFAVDHDYILAYLKNNDKKLHTKKWRVPQTEEYLKRYKETDEKGERYYWDTLARNGLKNPIPIELEAPDGSKVFFNSQKGLGTIETGLKAGHIKFTHTRNGWTLHHRVYMPEGQVLRSILDQVGTNKDSSDEMEQIFGNKKAFDYPKPESLIGSILNLATNSGDLVLDSFAGSGTTGAVAHKMGRRWVMVELGEHCHSHIIPRLQKVINGEDKGGVTESTGWQGGGGFRYYKLAPSLMKKDQWDNWVINPEYNQEMLVEAMCKLEGYTYTPSETEYWNHGKGSETDFIYVTTQTLSDQQLHAISEEVGEGRTLLIIASAWRSKNIDRFINLTLKKIPNSIIKACEWGHDDYSLNVQNLPMSEPDIEEKPKAEKVKNTQEQSQVTGDLFGDQT